MKFTEFKGPNEYENFHADKHLEIFNPDFLNVHITDIMWMQRDYQKTVRLKNAFELLIKNFDVLSNKQFFDLFKKFYSVSTDEIKEYIVTKTIKNPKQYTIKTDDIAGGVYTEGHGKDFSWWTEYYHVAYVVMAEDGSLDENRIYTKQELRDLVKSKKVIVMDADAYGDELDLKEVQPMLNNLMKIVVPDIIPKKFDYYFHFDEQQSESFFDKHKALFNLIRKDISKEQLLEDYNKFMKEFTRIDSEIREFVKYEQEKVALGKKKRTKELETLSKIL